MKEDTGTEITSALEGYTPENVYTGVNRGVMQSKGIIIDPGPIIHGTIDVNMDYLLVYNGMNWRENGYVISLNIPRRKNEAFSPSNRVEAWIWARNGTWYETNSVNGQHLTESDYSNANAYTNPLVYDRSASSTAASIAWVPKEKANSYDFVLHMRVIASDRQDWLVHFKQGNHNLNGALWIYKDPARNLEQLVLRLKARHK